MKRREAIRLTFSYLGIGRARKGEADAPAGKRIATPVCALARNDRFVFGGDSPILRKGAYGGRAAEGVGPYGEIRNAECGIRN